MGIPLSSFLFVYDILVGLFFVYALFSLFHVLRYGRLDISTMTVTALFIAGFVFIVFVSYTFIAPIDWSVRLNIFSNTFTTAPSTPFSSSSTIPSTPFSNGL